MKIRSHLTLLAFGAMAPLLVVLAVGGIALVNYEREAYAREAVGRARAAMSAVDAELRSSISTLRALATSKNLESGDLRAFHEEAMRVLASQHAWRNIGLATLDHRQLLDANRPYDQPARFGTDDAFDIAAQTALPQVGSLALGPAVSDLAVRIRFPVIINGDVRYVLSAPIDPASFERLLRAQDLPDGWAIGLVDRFRKIIARLPAVPVGTSVSATLGAAVDRAPQGWFAGRTLEGVDTYTPYVTSSLSGWVLAIAIPATIVEAGAWHALWIAAAGALAALAVALWLGWLFARRIATPIARLATAAQSGLDAPLPSMRRIDEVAQLHDALRDANQVVRERQRELEREQATLREQRDLLKQRTDELETLMQVMPIAVYRAEDAACTTINANPAGYRFLKQAPGTNISKPSAPDDRATSYRVYHDGREVAPHELPMQYSIAHGSEVRGQELEFRFADGTTRFGYLFAAPLFDASGNARGSLCTVLDITERKEADRRKDEFLATLAHELRNPLAPIANALQILKLSKHDSPGATKARNVLDRQVRQMQRLIDDLMDISRISRGKIVLQREPVALALVVRQAIDTCRPLLDAKGHTLAVDLPDEPVWLDADGTRLAQLITNLLGNACKFTPPHGALRIGASRQGRELALEVSDNGIGIAPGLLPRIFDMFVQGDSSLERSAGGLGIGLSLVRFLAQIHGGSVEAESDGVKGATFTVRLPIVIDAPPAVTPVAAGRGGPSLQLVPSAHAAVQDGSSRVYRVLVADDNVDTAQSLAMLLQMTGHEPHIAQDGNEALRVAEALHPRIALLDIGMPSLNGYDTARRLRAEPWGRDMLLIAISGWGQEADRLRSTAAGFDAHLVKPVDFRALTQVLAELTVGRAAPD